MGTAAEAFMLKGATRVVPSEIIMKWKMNFIGRILQLLEVQCVLQCVVQCVLQCVVL